MKVRLKQVDILTPQGVRIVIETQTAEGSLIVDRAHANALFVDIRDEGLPPHEPNEEHDGKARIVATYPSSWGFEYSWEVMEA